MQQRYEELTGIPADEASDIGIRLRILAEQLELLYQQLEEEKSRRLHRRRPVWRSNSTHSRRDCSEERRLRHRGR